MEYFYPLYLEIDPDVSHTLLRCTTLWQHQNAQSTAYHVRKLNVYSEIRTVLPTLRLMAAL